MSTPKQFYFAASIRGGREDVELYRELIDYLQTFGKVLTEHIGLETFIEETGLSRVVSRRFSVSSRQDSTKKFYFAASIRSGRNDAEIYRKLIEYIKIHGHVLSENEQLGPGIEREVRGETKGDKYIHDRDMAWLDESDALIAEVTTPSLGVGYEIGRAIERGKKILCLFRPDSGRVLSAMIRGAEDGKQLVVKDYKGDEAKKLIKDFLIVNDLI